MSPGHEVDRAADPHRQVGGEDRGVVAFDHQQLETVGQGRFAHLGSQGLGFGGRGKKQQAAAGGQQQMTEKGLHDRPFDGQG